MRHNASLTGTNKLTLSMKRGELMVGDKTFIPAVRPPTIQDTVFPIDEKHIEKTKLQKGEEKKKGWCKFVGYSAEARNLADVRAAYTKVTRLNPSALSIACAYRLPGIDFLHLRGCVDDDEHGAGRAIYFLLEDSNIFNRVVFVVRYFGNRHIGPVRFQLIKDAARSAINRSSYNSVAREHQMIGGRTQEDAETEVTFRDETTFRKPEVMKTNPGYATAASPRPFQAFQATADPSWGSMDSITSHKDFTYLRPRANSMDSMTSTGSYLSQR